MRLRSIFNSFMAFVLFLVFFALASWPLSMFSVILSSFLALLGIIIPFVNIRLTWWLYTTGGRTPLPEQHKWLEQKANALSKTKVTYTDFVSLAVPITTFVGFLGYLVLRRNLAFSLLFMKVLAIPLVFGLGLTFGTNLKKRQLRLP